MSYDNKSYFGRARYMVYTKVERQILINQNEILKSLELLKGQNANDSLIEDYDIKIEALRSGYTEFYDGASQGESSDELSQEEQQEVFDVLSMYDFILYNIEKSEEELPAFRGYDGNEEPNKYAFMLFFLNGGKKSEIGLNRFAELKDVIGENVNSHGFNSDREEWLGRYKELKSNEKLYTDKGRSVTYILTGNY